MKKIGLNTVNTFAVEMTEEEIEIIAETLDLHPTGRTEKIREDLGRMTRNNVHCGTWHAGCIENGTWNCCGQIAE